MSVRSYTINDPRDASSLGQPPTKTIHIMKITDYAVCPDRGIGLSGSNVSGGEVTEDGFTWFSIRSLNFKSAVDAVKELKKGEAKRIADNKKLMEGL